jgi:hypothetical protein
MSPQAGLVLVEQIVPRIRAAVPGCANTVGAEDIEELVQDCIAMAAQILHRVEQTGKKVTPGNIAYYAILHIKSGRRSQCGSRADAMAPGTQLDQKSSVLSFEEIVGFDMELGEPITLGEMLAENQDDPSVIAARNLDWGDFLDTHDERYSGIVQNITIGNSLKPVTQRYHVCGSTVSQLKKQLAFDIRETMGANILMEVCRKQGWQSGLVADKEKAACRADRRRQW